MKNIKYIRSGQKDISGKIIYSGQKVYVHGRINPRELVEVYFEPDYGFRIQGNNFADAYDIKIEKDIKWYHKIMGIFSFIRYTIHGFKIKEL